MYANSPRYNSHPLTSHTRGGSRCEPPPPPPDMACSFLIQLVFCKKKNYVVYWCWSRARDKCTPSQKNPGSAPAYRSPNLFWAFLCFGLELSPFFPKISSIHSTVSGKFCMYFVTDKNIVIWSSEFWWYVLHVRLHIMS